MARSAVFLLAMISVAAFVLFERAPASAGHCSPTAPPWNVPPGDEDCDGFSSTDEDFSGTLKFVTCPATPAAADEEPDAWPADFNDDQVSNILDIVQLTPPVFNSSPPNPNYTKRKDLNADNVINILDIVQVTPPVFNSTCTVVPRHKYVWPDRWYQRLSDSGSYVTWMTLTTHRTYTDPGLAGTWGAALTGAIDDWNDPAVAPNTVYFAEVAPSSLNDVQISILHQCVGCEWLGLATLYDQEWHECDLNEPQGYGDCDALHSRPNTWWYALLYLNDEDPTGYYTPARRQAVAAHELGHAIVLAHDGLLPGHLRDGQCGPPPVPETIMDYDCMDLALSPQPWDSCGINHVYFDPVSGYSGCWAFHARHACCQRRRWP